MIYNKAMRLLVIFCVLLAIIAGCAAPTSQTEVPATPDTEQQVEDYLSAGDYARAAEGYLRLAAKDRKNKDSLLLKAASAYLSGGEIELASSALQKVRVNQLTQVQFTEYTVLTARIASARNDAVSAIKMLDFTPPLDTPPSLWSDYHSARSLAFEMDRQFLNAIRSRIELDKYLANEDEKRVNRQSLWKALSNLEVSELKQELPISEGDLAGWLELAILSKTMRQNRLDLDNAITAWKQRYSAHPADESIFQELYASVVESAIRPRRIALLLPFGGQYLEVANAIRDGFMAAWYEDPPDSGKPVVNIYNTYNQNIMEVYTRAVSEEADFIAGPLEKESITTLISNNNVLINTLAFNQIVAAYEQETMSSPAAVPSLFQFALLPEDEAFQAADRAWFEGYANALIITPDSNWGDRIYNAFSTHWVQLGGKIVEHIKMPGEAQDMATPVKQLLNIDSSELRAKELTGILGRQIHFEPRHRQDAELIFIAASPVIARQLVPQFRFFGVNDLDFYSISSIFTGTINPVADSDLNGVVFPDMPWLIDPQLQTSGLQQSLNKNLDQDKSDYRRFYAFGIDAYHIIPNLIRLYQDGTARYSGVTGILKLDQQGYIQRETSWARFINGIPQLLDRTQILQ
jgi:Putative lipoprotein